MVKVLLKVCHLISTAIQLNPIGICVLGVRSIAPEVHKLRVIKSEAEIRLMRMSASIAAQSFQEVRNSLPQSSSKT
jgi:Xaa-Pro aminopeptidase